MPRSSVPTRSSENAAARTAASRNRHTTSNAPHTDDEAEGDVQAPGDDLLYQGTHPDPPLLPSFAAP